MRQSGPRFGLIFLTGPPPKKYANFEAEDMSIPIMGDVQV
jgi:hypothetical protein